MQACKHKTYKHTNIQTHKHTSIHTYKHTNIQTYKHTNIHTYMHAYIHTYIFIYTYIYIYTYNTHVYLHNKCNSSSSIFQQPGTRRTRVARLLGSRGSFGRDLCFDTQLNWDLVEDHLIVNTITNIIIVIIAILTICIVTILLLSLLLLLLLLLLFSLYYHISSILYYYQLLLLRINFHVDVSEKRFWCTPPIIKSLASWKIHDIFMVRAASHHT